MLPYLLPAPSQLQVLPPVDVQGLHNHLPMLPVTLLQGAPAWNLHAVYMDHNLRPRQRYMCIILKPTRLTSLDKLVRCAWPAPPESLPDSIYKGGGTCGQLNFVHRCQLCRVRVCLQ